MSRVFKRVVFAILFLQVLVFASIPSVEVVASSKSIQSGQDLKVVLKIKYIKANKIVLPKIKQIANYGIKNTRLTKSSVDVMLNGKKEKLYTKAIIYTIEPSKSFKIPSFSVEIDGQKYQTKPVNIKVIQRKKTTNNSGFIFKMSASKTKVAVGENFVVKVELIEPLNESGSDIKYIAPNFNGFRAMPLGDGQVIEQANQVVRTINYIVTATKPGEFTIAPARAKIGVQIAPQAAQSPFGFFGADIQWKNISSNALKIKAVELPSSVGLIGNFKIKTKVDKLKVKKNKPLNYTLIIEGEGSLDDFEDPKFNIDNVTVMSDDSEIEHKFENGKFYSRYRKHYVFISNRDFEIPSISITVYNPKNRKLYKIASDKIDIKVSKIKSIASLLNEGSNSDRPKIQTQKVNTNAATNKQAEETSKIEDIILDKEYYKRKYRGTISYAQLGLFLLLGLILGALGGVFVPKYLQKRAAKKGAKLYGSYKEALNILYPHIDEDAKIEEMVKFLYEVTNGNKEIKINDIALNSMIKKVLSKRDKKGVLEISCQSDKIQ